VARSRRDPADTRVVERDRSQSYKAMCLATRTSLLMSVIEISENGDKIIQPNQSLDNLRFFLYGFAMGEYDSIYNLNLAPKQRWRQKVVALRSSHFNKATLPVSAIYLSRTKTKFSLMTYFS
jgi:hypothetical protein